MERANFLRRVYLRPYRKGHGPSFCLTTYYTGMARGGRERLAYRLTMREEGKTRLLFAGDDYCPSPLHASDSDASMLGLLAFLTLRPGDTDAEYFAGYSEEQKAFASDHGEALYFEATCRFEEAEDGG